MSSGGGPGLAVGALFAGFRIEAILGSGGMGTVYRALDLNLDHERALKVLTPNLTNDDAFRERFQRESRMAAQLEDDGVVPIYGAGEADGRLYIAMRLVRGPDLHRLVNDEGPLDPGRAAAITAAVANALDAAHARGIIHRDVKPANILVEPGQRDERTFLTDFGISRPETATTEITSTGQLLGTPDYISPEQIDGARADARADVYALGCVVCFLLTGEAPFARDTPVATLYAHAHAERPRPSLLQPELPAAVDDVVARATAVDPAERYASAGALAGDLTAALDPAGRPATLGRAPVTPRTRELPRSARRRPWRLGLVAAAFVAIAVAAVLLWPSDDTTPEKTTTSTTADVSSIKVGDPVDSIVVGEVNVLAASQADSTLNTIDPETGKVGASPRVVSHPTSVAVGVGSVWVTSGSDDRLLRYGRANHDTPTEITVGSEPADVAVGDNSVWVANDGDGTVSQVDPLHNTVVATLDVARRPQSIVTTGNGDVAWVASASGELTKLDAGADDAASEPIHVGGRPADLAIVDDSLWEVDPAHGWLLKRSLDDGTQIGDPIDLGGTPVALAVGPGALWVADKSGDQAIRVDPAEPSSQERVDVDHRPVAVAVGAGSVWVASAGDESVTRIVQS